MITEDQLEQACLDWFKATGYEAVCGYDIAPDGDSPERSDYRQVILFAQVSEFKMAKIHHPHHYSYSNLIVNTSS